MDQELYFTITRSLGKFTPKLNVSIMLVSLRKSSTEKII